MTLFKPFCPIRPKTGMEEELIAPPYDVISKEEAIECGKNNPHNFIHISRAEIDCADDISEYSQVVYEKAKSNLHNLLANNFLVKEENPAWFIIQITDKTGHTQTGYAGLASVKAYLNNKILKHELTRPKKENDRKQQIKTLNMQTGPVLLTYAPNTILKQIANDIIQSKPLLKAKLAHDGSYHKVWQVNDVQVNAKISEVFTNMECMWIADGHHRSAAAVQIANDNPNDMSMQWFLSVAFPTDEIKILSYDRVITADFNSQAFIDFLQDKLNITEIKEPKRPEKKGHVCIMLDNKYLLLDLTKLADFSDNSLDVAILSKHILEPFFEIFDIRNDNRIDFIGGHTTIEKVLHLIDDKTYKAAFLMYPTQMQDIINIANDGEIMPPKSTWFEPKLADGLLSYEYD